MTIPLTPQISLSPSSYSASGQTITASVSVLNRPAYHGKPAITGLTTITPKIVINRAPAGVIPMCVQVSACETTCNAGNAYGDLHYEWDFGEPAGSDTFVDHKTGKTVNANSDQQGPEAVYVYRNAGTFTITLTAKGKDENGTLVEASTTTITRLGSHYIHLGGATGGSFDLTFDGQTASGIAWNASDATIETALQGLSNLDSTNCRLLKPLGRLVEFFGSLAGQSYSFTLDATNLTGVLGTPAIRVERASDTHASVVVSDTSGLTTNYFDPTYAGGAGVSNGSQTRPWATWAQLSTFVTGGSNRQLIMVDGSDITMTAKMKFDAGQRTTRIVRGGGGTRPIIRSTGNHYFEWEVTYGSVAYPDINGGDFVLSGVDLIFTGSAINTFNGYSSNNGTTSYPYGKYVDFLIDDCTWTSSGTTADQTAYSFVPGNRGGQFLAHVCLWKCSFDQGTADHSTVFVGGEQWFAVVGCDFSNGEGSILLDHYIYTDNLGHQCYRWNDFQLGEKSFCLNLNAQNTAGAVRHIMTDGCEITGLQNGFDLSNSNNDSSLSGYFDDVVIQFSNIHSGQINTQQFGILSTCLGKITVRYCDFWDNYSGGISNSDTVHPTILSLYKCRFYDSIVAVVSNQTGYVHDNLFHATSAMQSTWKVGLQFRGSASSVQTWDCDRNIWYCPNGTDIFYDRDASAYISFATWQSWGNDTNGSVSNPGFASPATGVFISNVAVETTWPAGFTSLESSIDDGSNWISYTNGASVDCGDIYQNTVVLFRAAAPGANGEYEVSASSSADSLDTATEPNSDTVVGSGLVLYLAITFGSNVLCLSYANN